MVSPITRAQMPAAWQALAASFDDDPMFRHLLPGRERAGWLRALMALALHQCVDDHMVFAPEPGPQAGAIALVGPGGFPPAPRLTSFAVRRWRRPRIPLPTRTLLELGPRILRDMEAVHYREPHLYVLVVGLHPDRKGQGLGRALMDHALEMAAAAGVPIYLETSNPVNLGFYRRFGFEVTGELSWSGTPPVWTMLRPA